MYCDIQEILSKCQAFIPIVGPFIFSPVKAVVSIAQAVGGIALGIIFKASEKIAKLIGDRESAWRLRENARDCLSVGNNGTIHLIYAAANFLSCGAIGFAIEWNKIKVEKIRPYSFD